MRQEPDRLDVLLMRVLDGEATSEERSALMEVADADDRLAELQSWHGTLREMLRESLLDESAGLDVIDVVEAVMAALTAQEDRSDEWVSVAGDLRSAFADMAPVPDLPPIDVAAAVMAAVAPEATAAVDAAAELSALHDGELSPARRIALAERLAADRGALNDMNDYAEMGRLVRAAIQAELRRSPLEGIWAAVAPAIGLSDPEEIPGWAPIGAALREAVHDAAALSEVESVAMTERVMAGIPRDPAPAAAEELGEPIGDWRQWLPRVAAPALVLAACLLTLLPGFWGSPSIDDVPGALVIEPDPGDALAALDVDDGNPVLVESLEYADDVVVQVLQFDDGGPVFLMIDDLTEDISGDLGEGADL